MSFMNVKLIHKDAKVPHRAHATDAGADLVATSVTIGGTKSRPYVEYGTGLILEVPRNHAGLLFPRSSVTNAGLSLGNSVGVIDPDFRGEVKVRFYFENKEDIYKVGDRVAQLVIVPIELIKFNVVEDINDTDRGVGGFGSSGV